MSSNVSRYNMSMNLYQVNAPHWEYEPMCIVIAPSAQQAIEMFKEAVPEPFVKEYMHSGYKKMTKEFFSELQATLLTDTLEVPRTFVVYEGDDRRRYRRHLENPKY